ncbi:MAG: hypothetical protein Kow009_08510 [Spirochaetales bacterium]
MKKETALLGTVLLLLSFPLFPIDSLLRIGGPEGFRSIGSSSGVRIRSLPEGGSEIILRDVQQPLEASTDLYLSFDRPPIEDSTGNWTVQSSTAQVTETKRARGPGSGAFFPESRIQLIPRKDTFLSAGIIEGGFTIQFWLYPATLGEGEGIFVYRKPPSSRNGYQEVSCRISGRTLVWDFIHLFQGPGGNRIDVTLKGTTPLVPREWRHHTLRYDASTGMIEYLLDGEPDAIVYATPSGREEAVAFYPVTEKSPYVPFVLGDGYNGLIDEFTVFHRFRESIPLKRYASDGGWFETIPLDLGYYDTRFIKLSPRQVLPGNSAVFYYYRIGNSASETANQEWIPLEPGQDLGTKARGRFLQLRAELYPDGTSSLSPKISELLVSYEPRTPPPPPSYVQAIPGDGEVLLRWSRVSDLSVKGYFVYYGWEPGVFKGNDSSLGPSPIKVGNQTELLVPGLTNGKLYYFSISAYDSSEDPLSSRLSATVTARPSRIYRNEQRNRND